MSSLSLRQETNQKQNQQLLLSLAMRQAFHVLQMPVVELGEWLKIQVEQNPVLEFLPDESCTEQISCESEENVADENNSDLNPDRDQCKQLKEKRNYQESLWLYQASLFEHMMAQARLTFENAEELKLAETIIGSLDHRGFLAAPLDTVVPQDKLSICRAILEQIQTFEPPGIAAAGVQESLLLQLRLKQKEDTLAYQIIEEHFDDLLHRRIQLLQKKLKRSSEEIINEISGNISPLDPHPGYRFISCPVQMITPDLLLHKQDNVWKIEVNEDHLPHFALAPIYQNALQTNQLAPPETNYIRKQLASGKWLKRIVGRRHQTLKAVARAILKRQQDFLNGDQKILKPMSLQDLSQELSLSESTIARSVANKYLFCPAGLFSLRSFFTHGIATSHGEKVSNHTLRQIMQSLIHNEDKHKPLSDSAISKQIQKTGCPCARRTIAKYRKHLKIPAAAKRKSWN